MENNLIQLAKTVAQISSELKSMRSVEEVINNLRRDVQELQKLNLGLSNSTNKPSELYRSASEPRRFNSATSRNDEFNSDLDRENQKELPLSKRKNKKETIQIPSFTNPRKLKKLTK